jgi:hypothetical protein
MYDPTLGRFLSPDPLRGALDDPRALNRYVYAEDNPAAPTNPTMRRGKRGQRYRSCVGWGHRGNSPHVG